MGQVSLKTDNYAIMMSKEFENISLYSLQLVTIFLIITSGPVGHVIRRSRAPWQLNVELRIWLIITRFPRVSSTTRSSFFSSVYSSETANRVYMTRQDNNVYEKPFPREGSIYVSASEFSQT